MMSNRNCYSVSVCHRNLWQHTLCFRYIMFVSIFLPKTIRKKLRRATYCSFNAELWQVVKGLFCMLHSTLKPYFPTVCSVWMSNKGKISVWNCKQGKKDQIVGFRIIAPGNKQIIVCIKNVNICNIVGQLVRQYKLYCTVCNQTLFKPSDLHFKFF